MDNQNDDSGIDSELFSNFETLLDNYAKVSHVVGLMQGAEIFRQTMVDDINLENLLAHTTHNDRVCFLGDDLYVSAAWVVEHCYEIVEGIAKEFRSDLRQGMIQLDKLFGRFAEDEEDNDNNA